MTRRTSTRVHTFPMSIAAIILVAMFGPASRAQTPAPSEQKGPQFADRIDVRLVTIPVLVRDGQGRPVRSLRAEDIQIVDGKQTYAAAFVSPFYEGAETRKDLPQVRLMTQVPGGSVEVARSSVREPRHLLILADVINDPPIGRKDAMESLSHFIEQELDPSFQVALMVFDGELRLRLPFTHDRVAAAAALRELAEERPRGRETLEARMEQLLFKIEGCRIEEQDTQFDEERRPARNAGGGFADERCLRDSMYEYAGEFMPRATAFVSAIEGAVTYAAGLEDHAFVLTIGGNVGLSPSREVAEAMRALFGPTDEIRQIENLLFGEDLVRPHLERVMKAAYRENVSLSFLDRSIAPSDGAARQRQALQPGFRPVKTAFDVAQQSLDEIASSTGGALVATTQVSNGLRESLDLAEGGYYVGFYVKDDQPMTQKRIERMKLRTQRSGITLKHRRAYEGARAAEDSVTRKIRGIIQVGFPEEQEFQGVRGNIIPLRIVFDPRDLGYKETEAQAVTEFSVHLRLRTPKGALLADSYHVLSHSYPRDMWASGKYDPPELRAWADLPDGDYFAEAIVTVPSLGHRGTIRRHLAVRGATPQSAAAQ
ncbi:MAG: VWA domain-containing protein [Thermoanaerobaculia bacterium]